MTLPLAIGLWGNLAVVLFILTCLALILIVLLQKGRGGGVGAAFGGGGGAGSLLGTKTGDVLTWITICLVAFFLVLAVLLGKFVGRSNASSLTPAPQKNTQPETAPLPGTDLATTPETTTDTAAEGATDVVEATTEVVNDAAASVAEEAEATASEAESAVGSVTDNAEENNAE